VKAPGGSLTRRYIGPAWVVGLAIAVWCLWFGRLALNRWETLSTGVFDLGIFDQGLWLLANGETPFVTLRGLHLFADHASYLLALLTPVYWVWSDPRALILLAVLAPAVAVWLTFRIGLSEGLGRWSAAAVALAVLAHPAMAWTPWDAFHPETLAIALIPAAYLAAARGRYGWMFAFGLLVSLAKEDAFLVVVPMAFYFGWRWASSRRWAWALGGSAGLIAVISWAVVIPELSPTGALIYADRMIFDPTFWLSWTRLGYIAALVVPVLVVVAAPRLLAIAIPAVLVNLVSAHGYQHQIRWHYTAYILGVLAIAAPIGLKRIYDRWGEELEVGLISDRGTSGLPIRYVVVAVSLAGLVLIGPNLSADKDWGGNPSAEHETMRDALEMIPDDAVVAASGTVATHLAHRTDIYMMPNPFVRKFWGVGGVVPRLPNYDTVEWMVVKVDHADTDTTLVHEWAVATGWVQRASVGGLEILQPPPD
jgi:uncharacterized membrane protein